MSETEKIGEISAWNGKILSMKGEWKDGLYDVYSIQNGVGYVIIHQDVDLTQKPYGGPNMSLDRINTPYFWEQIWVEGTDIAEITFAGMTIQTGSDGGFGIDGIREGLDYSSPFIAGRVFIHNPDRPILNAYGKERYIWEITMGNNNYWSQFVDDEETVKEYFDKLMAMNPTGKLTISEQRWGDGKGGNQYNFIMKIPYFPDYEKRGSRTLLSTKAFTREEWSEYLQRRRKQKLLEEKEKKENTPAKKKGWFGAESFDLDKGYLYFKTYDEAHRIRAEFLKANKPVKMRKLKTGPYAGMYRISGISRWQQAESFEAESFAEEFHDLDSDHKKYGESSPQRKEGFTPIGVYYVEGVGYCTGVAFAEEQTASFTGKPPVFYEWEYICDTCTYNEDECQCGLDEFVQNPLG